MNDTEDQYNITMGQLQNSSIAIKLWDGEEQRDAVVNENFKMIKSDAMCWNPLLLQPEYEEFDHFHILANGTLFFTHPNISENERILSTKNYCIIPSVSSDTKFQI